MTNNRVNVLCRYHYDPLDRLIGASPLSDFELKRFYCKSRLVTEIQGVVQRSIFQQADQLLAQHEREGSAVATSLLVTDQMRSVWDLIGVQPSLLISYAPYGHRHSGNGFRSLLGFNGERPDKFTGCYLLGNGYRAFNPVLMRFNSSDSLSPFGKGGLNSYTYCLGDPINRYDRSGHASFSVTQLRIFLGFKSRPKTFDILYKKETVDLMHNEFTRTKHLAPEPTIRQVKRARDLDYLQPGDEAKFVLTKDKKLVVGKLWNFEYKMKNNVLEMAPIHHGSLTKNQSSTEVISAGYLKMKSGGAVSINNHSGHYKPTFESLVHVKKYIEKNKISKDVNLVRQDN